MDNKFNFKVNFTRNKDYVNVDLYNSAFQYVDFNDIVVDFTLIVNPTKKGIEVELYSLDKLIIDYLAAQNDETDNMVENLTADKLKEYKISSEIGGDVSVKGLRLDGISVDLIKKVIILKFNDEN